MAAFTPLTDADAEQVASWRYGPPFDLYDSDGKPAELPRPDEHGWGYYATHDEQGVVAFVCFGPQGRVPGQVAEPGLVDVGMGVRPDAVSQGVARSLVDDLLAFARQRFAARGVRTAVAAFNERSLRLCRSAGLVETRRFVGPSGREFVELVAEL